MMNFSEASNIPYISYAEDPRPAGSVELHVTK